MAKQRKQAIEIRGEIYEGELKRAVEDVKNNEEILKLMQDDELL